MSPQQQLLREWDGQAPTCPNDCCGGKAENVIGVEVSALYDGVLFWHCAACGARWHRWAEGTQLRVVAEPYVLDFGVPATPSGEVPSSVTSINND